MSIEGKTCGQKIWSGFHGYTCGKKAKVDRSGNFYCGVHDPVRLKAAQDARDAERKRASDEQYQRFRKSQNIQNAKDAVVNLARRAIRQEASWDEVAQAVYHLEEIEK